MKINRLIFPTMLFSCMVAAKAAERPRLVVNMVVSRTTSDELRRYADNFGPNGLRLFMEQGLGCEESCYPFAVSTPSALATLSTGTVPAAHGIVSERWWDYNSGQECTVAADNSSSSFNCDYDQYRVSNKNIIAPTLSDLLLELSPESKAVSIGGDAMSAILLGGKRSTEVWWLDSLRAKWTTSTRYRVELPLWVKKYNSDGYAAKQLAGPWKMLYGEDRYRNTAGTVILPAVSAAKATAARGGEIPLRMISPAGNAMVADFVKEAVIYNRLGSDDNVDLLNVSFDFPRAIEERYGKYSREKEDMYYRLDNVLAEMMRFIKAQCDGRVLFVLTSDGGSSTVDPAQEFNVTQSMFLVSSFLSATYGGDNWVLGYSGGSVYLNRMQIYSKGLDLADIQRQIASFMLQFRGVANTYTASELMSASGHGELAERVVNSFYPKRSGDIIVVLEPGWSAHMSENDRRQAYSSSPYDCHTVVPLYFYGAGVVAGSCYDRVEMGSLATTLARIMGLPHPTAATAPAIDVLVEQFK